MGHRYAPFFSSQSELDHFTFSLDSLPSGNACLHCGKNDQWVSHGYIYKHLPTRGIQVAGKRILCDRRYGKNGCGRTRQLYLADIIPRRRYTLSVVIAFISALLAGNQVEHSFHHAIGLATKDARHASRWLTCFAQSLSAWRSVASLSSSTEQDVFGNNKRRSRRLLFLLPTLSLLLPQISEYQLQFQSAFF